MVKRIAVFTDNADPLAPLGGIEAGGENVYVNELTRALSRFGWTIDVFTRWSYPKTAQIAKLTENVRVIRLEAGPIEFVQKDKLLQYMELYKKSFLAFKEKNKLEYLLFHGNYYFSSWAAVGLGKQLRIPVVTTFHSLGKIKHMALNSRDPSPKERIALETEVMNGVDKIIATSPPMKEEIQTYYHMNPKKIAVVPGGVNLKRFTPLSQLLARRVLGINPNRLIVLYVGRIERRKGIDTLLSAMAEVVKRMPEKRKIIRLYITGGEAKHRWKTPIESIERTERERLKKVVDELGIKDIVRFVGGINRENLPYYYSAADMTVVPSFYEPFGLVPLESMACGTAVIASKVGGLQWTIRDGKTGYLVKPKDPLLFADKICYLLTHYATRKHMRENALDRVRRTFGWEAVASQMSLLYYHVIIDNYYHQLFGPGSTGTSYSYKQQ